MDQLSACPVCQGQDLRPYVSCEDHTVSHETFTLQKCERCGFVLTNPRPSENELTRYYQSEAYISHSNRSANIIDHIYKVSRHFTLKWKVNLIKTHSLMHPRTILDFGCGTGAFLSECKNHRMKVYGVEPSPLARKIALRATNATIWKDADGPSQNYDVITLWHVLEHVPLLHQTVKQLKGLLATNGTMFIAVPNLKSPDSQLYGKYWAGYDVPRHLWHFSPETMQNLLAQHQLNLVTKIPMKLDAYYVSLLSEKYQQGKQTIANMTRAFANAWLANQKARTTGQYSSLIYIVRK